MSQCRFLVGDVFEQARKLDDHSVDLVLTSPPFIGLRDYLPHDHPMKPFEIGLEATPAEFIDVMLDLIAVLRDKLTEHGSLVIELGDTYSESGGAGGDYYNADGWRAGQPKPAGSSKLRRAPVNRIDPERRDELDQAAHRGRRNDTPGRAASEPVTDPRRRGSTSKPIIREGLPRFDRPGHVHRKDLGPRMVPVGNGGEGWPLAKSKALIPELLRIALAYGLNPLTGQPSPAGLWRIRNVITWCRTNPAPGALGDKFRGATSDLVVACTSDNRWFDEVSCRVPASPNTNPRTAKAIERATETGKSGDERRSPTFGTLDRLHTTGPSAPPLDWWVIVATGYQGAHFAVYPPELCTVPIQTMCPRHVCTTCGEPRRPIVETANSVGQSVVSRAWLEGATGRDRSEDSVDRNSSDIPDHSDKRIIGWTECGCGDGCVASKFEQRRVPMLNDDGTPEMRKGKPRMKRERVIVELGECHDESHWRRGVVLDPFGGSGTTGVVATGLGRDAILIDVDERNAELARERIGMFLTVE